jgi:hypothetical protein
MVQVAVDVIHGLVSIADLSLIDVEKCCDGFDYLGCTISRKKLLGRAWHFVEISQTTDVLFTFADRLISSGLYTRDVFNAMKRMCPMWKDFKRLFDHVTMTEEIALMCMWRLCKFFPAHLVFDAVIDAFPPTLLTFDTCLKLMGCYRSGKHHHPDELVIASNKILSKFPDEEKAVHLQAISDAFNEYDVSPSNTKVIGTTLTFSNDPRTSVLAKIYDPFDGTKILRVKRFLTASINTRDGLIAGTVDIAKLVNNHAYPPVFTLRIMTYSTPSHTIDHSYDTTEVWRVFKTTDWGSIVHLDDPETYDPPNETIMTTALRSVSTLRYVRFDFFYGLGGDVRQAPIF